MMLVDFLREHLYDIETNDRDLGVEVSGIIARLRVMYENEIVPVPKTNQLDIVTEIEKLSAIGTVKPLKKKK